MNFYIVRSGGRAHTTRNLGTSEELNSRCTNDNTAGHVKLVQNLLGVELHSRSHSRRGLPAAFVLCWEIYRRFNPFECCWLETLKDWRGGGGWLGPGKDQRWRWGKEASRRIFLVAINNCRNPSSGLWLPLSLVSTYVDETFWLFVGMPLEGYIHLLRKKSCEYHVKFYLKRDIDFFKNWNLICNFNPSFQN